jgi:hypothetical protein
MICACLLCLSASANAADDRPHLLILGSYHMSNPGKDSVNLKADDSLSPKRQAEIEAVVESLAAFRPTHIAVERRVGSQAELDAKYAAYRAGTRALAASEDEQIGMRLAKRLGLPRVDAIDVDGTSPGEPPAPNLDDAAKSFGQQSIRDAIKARDAARVAEGEARLAGGTVADTLRYFNETAQVDGFGREYFNYLRIADATQAPGADWLQRWYGRNLKILVNIERIAHADDRILVIYGFGHTYLLSQFARESGAFIVEDTLRFLPGGLKDHPPHPPAQTPAHPPRAK